MPSVLALLKKGGNSSHERQNQNPSPTKRIICRGPLCSWGCNNQGELGLGKAKDWIDSPVLVEGIEGGVGGVAEIVDVSTMYQHTGAVTVGGNVYMWGWNSSGQLGQVPNSWF